MFERALRLPPAGTETFFLWGPRQTGKTTLLGRSYPEAHRIDLLAADAYRRYLQRPESLREELAARPEIDFVVVDEVQKIPALLDEIQLLHDRGRARFALCGSSARKVRHGAGNLLGGRALRLELFGLVSHELGDAFDLDRLLDHGYLPRHFLSDRPRPRLNAYVADYLREEVAAEGLVRRLAVFSAFLDAAALSDTEPVNMSNIARECGVSSTTVKSYFGILEDTLLGGWLPAYRRRPKRRIAASPKFYFADVGVVNFLARRGRLEPGSELYGKALENWVHHELRAHDALTARFQPLSYWRLTTGTEVDFLVGDAEVAIEVKATPKVTTRHLKGLRELRKDHAVGSSICVCLEPVPRKTDDDILVLPAREFARRLWADEIL